MKKVIVAGGTGFLGKNLVRFLIVSGYEVVILTRRHREDYDNVRFHKWDGKSMGGWSVELEKADVLINLTGRSVDCRYTDKNKQLIYDSRLLSTEILGKAIQSCKTPPKVWINAASATIYRHALDRPMDEATGEFGNDFSVDVCKKWEKAFNDVFLKDTRKVILRIAIILGKEGGVLKPMKNLVKAGIGGKQGVGNQYISWLHEDDFVRVVDHVINHDAILGTYNASAPYPVTNSHFMTVLRKLMGYKVGLPLPSWLLKIGAVLIGTEAELILKSRWVIPKKLIDTGFKYKFETVEMAIEDLMR